MTGTLAALQAAVNGLTFAYIDWFGQTNLLLQLNDSLDNQIGSRLVDVNMIGPVPPSITAPSAVSLNENGSFTFSNSSISVTDVAATATGKPFTDLTLSVTNGKLLLASTTGLTFYSGSNDSSSMRFDGTPANVNAAVNGLMYVPNPGYSGPDSLQMSIVDDGSGSATVAITVFAPPTVTTLAALDVNENSSYAFFHAQLSLTDAAASGTSDSVTLSVSHGTLTLGSTTGLTFTSGANGSSSMTVSGTLANLNTAVGGLVYTPSANFSGHDSIQIFIQDAGDNQTGSAAVAVSVNPFITAPVEVSVKENGLLTFSLIKGNAITLTDGAASGASDSLTLTVSHGLLTLGSTTGITFVSGSNNSSSMTINGTLAKLNAALRGLRFIPTSGYAGFDRLLLSLSDSGDGLSGTGLVAIRVNGQPKINAPATATTVMNMPLTFSSANGDPITMTDATASGTLDSMTLTVTHGILTLVGIPGLTFTSGANGSSSMTVRGALAGLNSALNGLVYTPTTGFTGSASLKNLTEELARRLHRVGHGCDFSQPGSGRRSFRRELSRNLRRRHHDHARSRSH